MANIKCYNHDADDPLEERIVRVAKTEEGFDITKNGKSLSFKVGLMQFYPDMANVFEGYHELFLVWSSGNSCDKAGYASAIFRNRGFENNHIGSVFVDANGTPYFFTRYPVEPAEGTEIDVVPYDASGTRSEDVFVRTLPAESGFVHWNQRHRAKINFLGHISTNDSLTMLESQLDLLTKVVLATAPDSEEKTALAEATEGNTVLSLHELEKVKQTIQRQKSYIRAEQKKYFDERGVATNADLSS
nr:MAG TPA: hypothetical protein [Bacteriophage sp.]